MVSNVILAAMWVNFYEATLERRFRLPVMVMLWTAATALWFAFVYVYWYAIFVEPVAIHR